MIIIPEDVLRIAEALSAPIDELGLSVRSYNGLRRWGITTVADVYRAHQDKQLPRIRNLGEKSVIEIEKHLEEHLAKVAPASSSEFPNNSDTISRAKAIDTLRGYLVGKRCPDDGTLTCRLIENEVINKLPPAQLSTNLAEVGTDCISRRAAIGALRAMQTYKLFAGDDMLLIDQAGAQTELMLLPSAQPEIIRCRECKFASGDSRICMKFGHSPIGELDFCSFAERREVTE